MPLNTQIIRDGEPLKMPNGWGHFHIAAMALASGLDDETCGLFSDRETALAEYRAAIDRQGFCGISPAMTFQLADYCALGMTPLNDGSYTLKQEWRFADSADGETLVLLPGDELKAWRGW